MWLCCPTFDGEADLCLRDIGFFGCIGGGVLLGGNDVPGIITRKRACCFALLRHLFIFRPQIYRRSERVVFVFWRACMCLRPRLWSRRRKITHYSGFLPRLHQMPAFGAFLWSPRHVRISTASATSRWSSAHATARWSISSGSRSRSISWWVRYSVGGVAVGQARLRMILRYVRLLWPTVVGMVRLLWRITVHLWWTCMLLVRRLCVVALTVVLWRTMAIAVSLAGALVVATAATAWIHFRFFF
jgi:hypothetical protein